MHDARNVAPIERWISFAAGGVLAAAAAHLIYRALTGYCSVYAALGISSVRDFGERNPGASVPYGTGVRVEESVSVEVPAADLYAFWRKLDTLPQFMKHIEEITVLTPTRSRWRVRAPIGSRLSWEAEIINDVPGELIGWHSLPGSPVRHAGSVHFYQRGSATEVRVELEYAPPARYVGASIVRLLGEDPKEQIAHDLQRFKSLVERGQICAS